MTHRTLSPRATAVALAAVMLAAGAADSYAGSGASTEVYQPPVRVSANVAAIQVSEIFNATPVLGWPHILRPNELRGLQREAQAAYRMLYPRGAGRSTRCRNLFGAPQCAVVNRRGIAVKGMRIRLWEDGSARLRFFNPDMD